MNKRLYRAVRRLVTVWTVSGGLLAASSMAQANLLGRDLNGDFGIDAYYDTALDITWLKDANYAATALSDARRDAIIANVGSVADVTIPEGHALTTSDFYKAGGVYNGWMTWWGAMAWAQDLTVGSYNGWRLSPINLAGSNGGPDDCRGYKWNLGAAGAPSCAATGNELMYMYYYNLDGSGYEGPDLDKTGNQTTVDGATLTNIGSTYWTTSEIGEAAWLASLGGGWTDGDGIKDQAFYKAWAVHSGDIGLAVAEPAILGLFGVAIAGLGFSRRRKDKYSVTRLSKAKLGSRRRGYGADYS